MISQLAIHKLVQILGEEHILTKTVDLSPFSHDATNQDFVPDAVAFPQDADQISKILQLANEELFPVIPRGAGSGMSGGAVAVRGGLVLSMERLNKILLIDEENLLAKVEPGVVTAHLQEEVEKCGLFYPPDPASLDVSTIGGNVAECAGGPRAVKYGVTRDYVMGLKVVLPTGDSITTGVETAKGVVGYDLTRLIVGSEGTLAVIVEIILKLLPKPEMKRTMLIRFSDIAASARCVSKIIREKVVPTTIEFLDSLSVECVRDQVPFELPLDDSTLLLIEVDGDSDQIDHNTRLIEALCRKIGSVEFRLAKDKEEAEELWKARKNLSPSLQRLRPHKINQDVVVPRSRLPDFVIALSGIGRRYELPIPSFGHAGDGNIHVNIMYDADDKNETERAHQALQEILRLTLDLRGTLSGEHGVGISKKPYIGMEITPTALELMRKIKKAFDPNGILNPAKIFDEA
ncbi:MAG: FAD-binding protein [Deltaproteobacteria bacterium]|nr:FAD-binding protein [Deltaproteobacteria bacterium]